MQTWGAIFDWDGVVVDSSEPHQRSWELLAAEARRALPPDYFKRSFGMKSEQIIPDVLCWTHDPGEIARLTARKGELYRQLLRQGGIQTLPGAIEWLHSLQTAGVPCCIASSTNSKNIRCAIDVLQIGAFFADMVAGENVSHGKPDPEVFLLAAGKLRHSPSHCVVFEDAHVGIEAARAAGMRVVGVATTHPADTLQDADRVVKRLDELTIGEVEEWFRSSGTTP